MVNFSISDKRNKINGEVDKLNSYNEFSSYISFMTT